MTTLGAGLSYNPDAYVGRRKALFHNKKFIKATMDFTWAISIGRRDAEVFHSRAVGYEMRTKWDKAAHDFYVSISLTKRPDSEQYNALAWSLYKTGKPALAKKYYRHAIGVDAENYYAWDTLGSALEEQGLLDDAIAADKNAYQLDPENKRAFNTSRS